MELLDIMIKSGTINADSTNIETLIIALPQRNQVQQSSQEIAHHCILLL